MSSVPIDAPNQELSQAQIQELERLSNAEFGNMSDIARDAFSEADGDKNLLVSFLEFHSYQRQRCAGWSAEDSCRVFQLYGTRTLSSFTRGGSRNGSLTEVRVLLCSDFVLWWLLEGSPERIAEHQANVLATQDTGGVPASVQRCGDAVVATLRLSARGLRARDWNNLSDPYFELYEVTLRHDGTLHKRLVKRTEHLPSTLDPDWGEVKFGISLPRPNMSLDDIKYSRFLVEVWDDDRHNRDDPLGYIHFEIREWLDTQHPLNVRLNLPPSRLGRKLGHVRDVAAASVGWNVGPGKLVVQSLRIDEI